MTIDYGFHKALEAKAAAKQAKAWKKLEKLVIIYLGLIAGTTSTVLLITLF